MNRTKKVVIVLLTVFLWIVGLFFLTRVVLITNNRTAKKSDIDLDRLKNDSVVFAFEKVTSSQNLFRDVTASGWAFIEHDGENPNKRLYLIFASEEESYIFEMRTYDRIDLNTAPILANYLIPKFRNGFEGTFSPLMMKNGIYRQYFFIQENEHLDGIIDTGKEYTKYFGTFVENVGGEEIQPVTDVSNTNVIVNSHFLCDVENTIILISGWAFVEEGSSTKMPSQPIIKLLRSDDKTSFYSTVSVSRVDVAQSFNAKELLLSGFSSEIPSESLGKGDNIFSIIFDGLGESIYTCTVSSLSSD